VNPVECAREADVLEAMLRQQLDFHRANDVEWLDGGEDLRRHVAECEICAEVAAVASLLREDHEVARHHVQVPASGQVWWRAAVRARLDGAQAAARPLTWAQGIAGASAVGVGVGVMGLAWPTIDRAAGWLGSHAWSVGPPALAIIDVVSAAVQRSLPFAIAAAAGLVLAPLALYLALSDD
jgi:hypothetical protein